jgi:hypothetical protein
VYQQNAVKQFIRAIFHELFRSKRTYNIFASAILLGVVVVGYFWQEFYQSRAVISAVTRPFLLNSATNSSNSEQLEKLISRFNSTSFIEKILARLEAGSLANADLPALDADEFIKRSSIFFSGQNFVTITYLARSPQIAEQRLQTIVNTLLEMIAPENQLQALNDEYLVLLANESRLRNLLQEKESNIREMKAVGRLNEGGGAASRITSLRETLQDVDINISTIETKIDSVRKQLQKEHVYQSTRARVKELRDKRERLINIIEENKKNYSSGSPELVSKQIELDNINLELSKRNVDGVPLVDTGVLDESLYEQLRKQFTLDEVELEVLSARGESLQKIYDAEIDSASDDRSQDLALEKMRNEFQELDERYEEAKKARNTIIEKRQKITAAMPKYSVIDRPSLPKNYIGLGFVEFLVLGPILAFGIPFLLAALLVLGDKRVRTIGQMKKSVPADIAVLGVIPHYDSPMTLRVFRNAIFGLVAWGIFVFSVYLTVGVIGLRS